jgi:amino-acid N-acetyltransferase
LSGRRECRKGDTLNLRQARVTDVPAIHGLIGRCADGGAMLPRSRSKLYETVRDFVVAEDDGRVVGAGALRTLWEDLGEICSLAVEESHRRQGVGRAIVDDLLDQARSLGLKRVFALTFIPGYFGRFDFDLVDKASLPHKVWTECVNCPKFPDCDEQAMIRDL